MECTFGFGDFSQLPQASSIQQMDAMRDRVRSKRLAISIQYRLSFLRIGLSKIVFVTQAGHFGDCGTEAENQQTNARYQAQSRPS